MRVFLKKPKWLTYLLLFIILIQVLPPFARYYLGSDEWVKYQSSTYGFAIQYPGNWTPESYQGSSPGLEGVVAILADSPGFIEASRLLTIYMGCAACGGQTRRSAPTCAGSREVAY